jgi:hypothetical protein
VPSKSQSPQALMAEGGPKRLELLMLLDAPAQEFSKAIRGGLKDNLSESELSSILTAVQALVQQVDAVGRLRKGDTIRLDDDPARGVSLLVNGVARGPVISDRALFAAVLRIFLGDRPVDARLKSGLLGTP